MITNKIFMLVIDNKIDTVSEDYNGLVDYCLEIGKKGSVYLLKSVINFDSRIEDIVTSTELYSQII